MTYGREYKQPGVDLSARPGIGGRDRQALPQPTPSDAGAIQARIAQALKDLLACFAARPTLADITDGDPGQWAVLVAARCKAMSGKAEPATLDEWHDLNLQAQAVADTLAKARVYCDEARAKLPLQPMPAQAAIRAKLADYEGKRIPSLERELLLIEERVVSSFSNYLSKQVNGRVVKLRPDGVKLIFCARPVYEEGACCWTPRPAVAALRVALALGLQDDPEYQLALGDPLEWLAKYATADPWYPTVAERVKRDVKALAACRPKLLGVDATDEGTGFGKL
jgi:hypothetical protein